VRASGESDDHAVRRDEHRLAELVAKLGGLVDLAEPVAQVRMRGERVAVDDPRRVRPGGRDPFRFEVCENGVVQSGRPISQ
jgi:hypothetical protein